MTMSWSPSRLLVWANSRSNGFPVGRITLPSGSAISHVNVPVTLVTTVIQSPPPNWIGYVRVVDVFQRLPVARVEEILVMSSRR
jgi:hypothetical protein